MRTRLALPWLAILLATALIAVGGITEDLSLIPTAESTRQ